MGLEAGGRGGTEEKEKEEKIPHMCESIGHRPLRGRCPKRGPTDRPNGQTTEGPKQRGVQSWSTRLKIQSDSILSQ